MNDTKCYSLNERFLNNILGPKLNITAARLVNGTSLNDGRAEIKVNDTWGTICDANFGMNAADLFCNLLGLR